MVHSTQNLKDLSLPMPITTEAQRLARKFAAQQSTPQKADRVYLNTLAVCVVNNYLQMMEIPTELTKSDIWNPVVRLASDVADLKVKGLGTLECRPVRSHQLSCHIPLEVWDDRLGYVVVQLDDLRQQAVLLGFAKKVTTQKLPISQLQSMDDFLEHLDALQYPRVAPVNLSQWFQNIFTSGWQTLETLLNTEAKNLAFVPIATCRDGVRRYKKCVAGGKIIDLGMQLAGHSVALIIITTPEENQEMDILVQVHPMDSKYLPPNLRLIVSDDMGTTILEARARSADNYIQLNFSGTIGERFQTNVAFGNSSITEDFAI